MFANSGPFWFLMGVLTVVVAAGFRAFTVRRRWTMTWWKWGLTVLWYGLFSLTFLALGTLVGEGEAGAGIRMGLLGLFVCGVLGVGLWRLLARQSRRLAPG